MPQRDISSAHFSSVRPVLKSSQSVNATVYANTQSIATMDTYLLTQGYTQATLDGMTKNDKVFAVRGKTGLGPQ